ncbi:MAG: alpha/beta hydrolase [Dyella sp.]
MPIQHLSLPETTLSYVEYGQGAPLLLVHGSLCDQRYWEPQLAALAVHHRVIALSLRHYWPQRWDGVGEDFSIEQHAADVVAFIEALQLGPVHLCGHSRGGLVALRVAQRSPQRLRGLILAEPGGRAGALATSPLAQAMPQILAQIQAGAIDAALEHFLRIIDGPRGWSRTSAAFKQMARDNAITLLGQAREPRPPLASADLHGLTLPTLLIGGERSPPAFVAQLEFLQQALPAAHRVTVPRAAHPMNVENATVFNRSVLAFLSTLA